MTPATVSGRPEPDGSDRNDGAGGIAERLGLWLGPLLAIAVYILLGSATLDEPARRLAGVTVLMAVWWITEAIP
ncbi:MAG: anion transporter, partial [Planctomycetota bacterium]